MRLFAVGDLHLSFGLPQEKPMDIFGPEWEDHAARLRADWLARVTPEDAVLLCGDISWALRPAEALADLAWIHALPGQKVLVRGNHDLWWQSIGRLRALYPDGSMRFLQNDAVLLTEADGASTAVCGSRGWICPGAEGFTDHDRKLYERECIRLRMSLEAGRAAGAARIVAMLHYPPTNEYKQESGFTALLTEYGVETCVYGHLHGRDKFTRGLSGLRSGVRYRLVSLDYLRATLWELPARTEESA